MPQMNRAAQSAAAKAKAAAAPVRNPKAKPKAEARPAESVAAKSVATVLTWLERNGSETIRKGMARYAIPSDKAFGFSVGSLRKFAKSLYPHHELAAALWKSGWYEARILASFIDDPAEVTAEQMDRWCADFDNWAICDTACFVLFDRTPHAWRKVEKWARSKDEFVKRAAFALLASLTVHDKVAADALYAEGLALVERAANDDRNFVKKAVNWALRSIGKRNAALNDAAIRVAKRLAASSEPAARWVGKDALRELSSAAVQKRLAARASARKRSSSNSSSKSHSARRMSAENA